MHDRPTRVQIIPSLQLRNGKRAPRSQLSPKPPHDPHPHDDKHTDTSEHAHALANTQVRIERACKVNCSCSQGTPAEIIRREEGSVVLWIDTRDVDTDALKHDEDTGRENSNADDGNDPVNTRPSSPTEQK